MLDEDGALIGMVARADVLRWTMSGWAAGTRLRDALGEQELVTGYEDELVGPLADRMAAADIGRVPILRRSDDKLDRPRGAARSAARAGRCRAP